MLHFGKKYNVCLACRDTASLCAMAGKPTPRRSHKPSPKCDRTREHLRFDINSLRNPLTRFRLLLSLAQTHQAGPVQWGPGQNSRTPHIRSHFPRACRRIIWSRYPHIGLARRVCTAGCSLLTGLTSSLAELIKSFKVREVGQISSEHLSPR